MAASFEFETSLVSPTVNINGDTRGELIAQMQKAATALRNASEVYRAMSPHGRNYPQGNDAFMAARSSHAERLMALRTMEAELEAMAIALLDETPK